MPGLIEEHAFKTITVKELHPTFAAEILGVNFNNVPQDQFTEVLSALAKYGVCVFRTTGLTDSTHVTLSRRFGALDNIKRYMSGARKMRYDAYELFDAGNVSEDGAPHDPDSHRAHANRGNGLFHVDSSFNPRRASYCLLRAVALPPPGYGGDTMFADSRTAAEEMEEGLRARLMGNGDGEMGMGNGDGEMGMGMGMGTLVGVHSMAHSRKLASPEFFRDMDVTQWPMARHRILQRHEQSGRMNLYVGAHMHHIEDVGDETESCAVGDEERTGRMISDGPEIIQKLNEHVAQDKYLVSIPWYNPGDMIIWDNRCVLHRAGPGTFEGKYVRDLRRTTVHDDSPTAWGFNTVGEEYKAFTAPVAGK
ncbi:alpha-ketoglutarate-dependent 2,4-dichlorophenoxyacetate dioxygenase [Xylariaceae sp. FL1272]|nr:alpha-ketoglutarate-dependent 2,4-dichlorophenoxyacetate dioxygenase [Xylariaceae sp. FL1272]